MSSDDEFNGVFDDIFKIENINQAKRRIAEMKEQNRFITNTCGHCYFWMTQQCVREKGHKVNCNESKCVDFKLGLSYDKIIEKNENEIIELRNKIELTETLFYRICSALRILRVETLQNDSER